MCINQFYWHLQVFNKQFTDKDGKQAKETVKVDIKNQVAETDVKKEGSEVKIISDLKRVNSIFLY